MAGAGKTSVGKALSLELGYEFLDTDKIIEISYGKSKDIIDSDIFTSGKVSVQNPVNGFVINLIDKKNTKFAISSGFPNLDIGILDKYKFF